MSIKRCAAILNAIDYHYKIQYCACLRAKLRTSTSPNLISTLSSQIIVLYVTWQYINSINSRNSQINMYQIPLNYRIVGQCVRGLCRMTTCNEAGLSAKFLTHVNVEYHIHLISWYHGEILPSGLFQGSNSGKTFFISWNTAYHHNVLPFSWSN